MNNKKTFLFPYPIDRRQHNLTTKNIYHTTHQSQTWTYHHRGGLELKECGCRWYISNVDEP